ncbi:MAG: YfiR family protein [Burkholderiales bacterium]|nr:YfiR family protein [Burkholderiales bacterium]
MCSLSCAWAQAQSDYSEAKVKAAFVFNFFKYTEWPVDATTKQIVLCLGNANADVNSAFAPLEGRVANGRAVSVRNLPGSLDASGCNAVYIHDGAAKKVLEKLVQAKMSNVLTVGDGADFLDAGGIIGLVETEGRMQFDVNPDPAVRGNLRFSSQMLKLARNNR